MKPCKTCEEFSCGANGSDYVSMRCGSEEGFIRVDADCLPNAAELVEEKRNYARAIGNITLSCGEMNILAGAYEDILAENARLKSERDAAVADLRDNGSCFFCKHYVETDYCERGCRWEWRGVQDV